MKYMKMFGYIKHTEESLVNDAWIVIHQQYLKQNKSVPILSMRMLKVVMYGIYNIWDPKLLIEKHQEREVKDLKELKEYDDSYNEIMNEQKKLIADFTVTDGELYFKNEKTFYQFHKKLLPL